VRLSLSANSSMVHNKINSIASLHQELNLVLSVTLFRCFLNVIMNHDILKYNIILPYNQN
jgi:hypothetical protein